MRHSLHGNLEKMIEGEGENILDRKESTLVHVLIDTTLRR
jgi:hypothetical protein